MIQLLKVLALLGCFLAAGYVEGDTLPFDRTPEPSPILSPEPLRTYAGTVLEPEPANPIPILLPPLSCDSPAVEEFADELITLGWLAEPADKWGEALIDPYGRVVVRFAC